MTFASQIREHQARCQPHLAKLQMLTPGEAAAAHQGTVAAVRLETSAILAEAEAAIRATLAATAGSRKSETETFLLVRLNRLAAAADDAVTAAGGEDGPHLHRHVRRFDALTSAIWAVQHAVYSHGPPHPAR